MVAREGWVGPGGCEQRGPVGRRWAEGVMGEGSDGQRE